MPPATEDVRPADNTAPQTRQPDSKTVTELYDKFLNIVTTTQSPTQLDTGSKLDFGSPQQLFGLEDTLFQAPIPEPERPSGASENRNESGGESQHHEKTPVEQERDRLTKDAEKILDPTARQQFLDNINKFEERARKQGLSDEEIKKTYENISKLLEATNGKLPTEQNLNVAQQVAHHLANPSNIDQGFHGTCSVTALEERIFTTNPATATDMIVQGALTGEYRAADGKVIKLDPSNLIPGREELDRIPQDGSRSFASQIFQSVALNDIFQRQDPPLTYAQSRPGEKGASDTGERLVDKDGKVVSDFGGIGLHDLNEESKRLIGKPTVLDNENTYGKDALSFKTKEELQAYLKEAKEKGNLPLVIAVDANNPLFGAGDPEGKLAGHVVTITDYNPETGEVTISNQWGSGSDKKTTIDKLFEATQRFGHDKPKEEKPWWDWWKNLWPF